jgi:site-specific recombinase XerD
MTAKLVDYLRHNFASLMLLREAKLKFISEALGHMLA